VNRLIWNGHEVELSNTTKIGITYQVNNIAELQNRQGNFSNIFKIPKTRKNNLIFEFANNTNSDTNYKRAEVSYYEDEIPIVEDGVGYLESVDEFYNVRVTSGIATIFSKIEWLKVGRLYQDNPRGNFIQWIHDEIVNSRDGSKYYIFPLVAIDSVETNNIISVSDEINETKILPFLFVRDIFERACALSGYTLGGNFGNSDIMQRLILSPDTMSYSQDIILGNVNPNPDLPAVPFYGYDEPGWGNDPDFTGTIPRTGLGGGTFTYYIDNISPAGHIAFFYSGYYVGEPPNIDTIGFYGTVNIEYRMGFNIHNGGSLFTPAIEYGLILEVLDDETNEVLWISTLLDEDNDDWADDNGPDFYFEGVGEITKTWKPYQKLKFNVKVKIQEAQTTDLEWEVQFVKFKVADVQFKDIQSYGGVLFFNQMFNMLTTDLMKDVMNMFAVNMEIDDINKIAKFNFQKNVSENKNNNYIDWSNKKIDINGMEISFIVGNYAQRNRFKYTPNDTVKTGYGDSEWLIDNDTLPLDKTVVQLKTSATEHGFETGTTDTFNIPRIKLRLPSQTEQKVNNRILILDKQNMAYNMTFKDGVTQTSDLTTMTDIPFAYFDKIGADYDLRFESLIEIYYTTVKLIIAVNKKVQLYILLNSNDIVNLDFNKPIYLNVQGRGVYVEGYYYLNMVYQYKGGMTKIELAKL